MGKGARRRAARDRAKGPRPGPRAPATAPDSASIPTLYPTPTSASSESQQGKKMYGKGGKASKRANNEAVVAPAPRKVGPSTSLVAMTKTKDDDDEASMGSDDGAQSLTEIKRLRREKKKEIRRQRRVAAATAGEEHRADDHTAVEAQRSPSAEEPLHELAEDDSDPIKLGSPDALGIRNPRAMDSRQLKKTLKAKFEVLYQTLREMVVLIKQDDERASTETSNTETQMKRKASEMEVDEGSHLQNSDRKRAKKRKRETATGDHVVDRGMFRSLAGDEGC